MLRRTPRTAADLRGRAARLRQIAREFPDDQISQKLSETAAQLDARALAMEGPAKPDAADP